MYLRVGERSMQDKDRVKPILRAGRAVALFEVLEL